MPAAQVSDRRQALPHSPREQHHRAADGPSKPHGVRRRLRNRAVLQIGDLRWHCDVTDRRLKENTKCARGAEGITGQFWEQLRQRDIEKAPDNPAHRQDLVYSQSQDQTQWQRLLGDFVLIFWRAGTKFLATRSDDGALTYAAPLPVSPSVHRCGHRSLRASSI